MIAASGGQPSWESLATWGYLPPQRVWDGAYWGLVSSAFVHLALWHLAFSGLLFGLLAARWMIPGTARRTLAMAGTGLLLVLSLVPLFWSPWSWTWVGYKAYKSHLAGDYDTAIAQYRRSIALGGDRLWALGNIAFAYHSKGARKEYAAILAEIRAVDAAAAAKVEAETRESPDTGAARAR